MAQMPKKVKYRKSQRGKIARHATRGATLEFGEYGLQSLAGGWMSANQIEAVRVALTRNIKRKGKIWIRVFPHKPVSQKPAEVRMGKGKGAPEFWVAVVKPGQILYEMEGVSESLARESMRLGAFKLPFPCRFVVR
ncbi:MAG: 50S ribosomal protein L16, partial [Candidatus Auribacterota bacterium]|nr:50S ribosomal protein L16 [Candidatus Auribacterota bacterium]